MDAQKTGQLIANARKEKMLTQADLGEAIFRTAGAVSKWERGLSFPDVFILESLAMNLDLSVLELIRGEKIVENHDFTRGAQQSAQDILKLFSDEYSKNCIPEPFRSFFAFRTWIEAFSKILLLIAIIYCVVGGILFFAIKGTVGIILLQLGLLFFIFYGLLALLFLHIFSQKKQLLKSGVIISAIVKKIRVCHFISCSFQKTQHPYQIFFEYAFNGRIYKGKSFFIWERPELEEREVDVFINPNHPRQYYFLYE